MADEPEVIRRQMAETRASLAEKLDTLERQVVRTVEGATSAVTDTVETVKESVQSGVQTVRETLDVRRQVDEHPWAMVGLCVGLGYVGGLLHNRLAASEALSAGRSFEPAARPWPETAAPAVARAPSRGWIDQLAETFAPEIQKMKGLAIGTALGAVRDLVDQSAPQHMRAQLHTMMDNMTTKLGGEPIPGPVLEERHVGPGNGQRYSSSRVAS
jgi:hypothetical protein